jgi:glutathione S-transferase
MLVIGYWPIRGLCQPIRLLLEYVGASYRERHYVTGPAPAFDKTDWLEDPERLDLDLPNLPYLIDGDLRLTESSAILRYLDRKHGLLPDDARTQAIADMFAGFARDLAWDFMSVCYADVASFESAARAYTSDDLPRRLSYVERYLEARPAGMWLASGRPCYVDFLLYEVVDQHRALAPTVVDRFPALTAYSTQVAGLPAIAAYLSSDRCLRPINNRMASFGG